ncbi:hypothetical protein U1Q18_009781 [Sarracenia purpurea var. burkii]
MGDRPWGTSSSIKALKNNRQQFRDSPKSKNVGVGGSPGNRYQVLSQFENEDSEETLSVVPHAEDVRAPSVIEQALYVHSNLGKFLEESPKDTRMTKTLQSEKESLEAEVTEYSKCPDALLPMRMAAIEARIRRLKGLSPVKLDSVVSLARYGVTKEVGVLVEDSKPMEESCFAIPTDSPVVVKSYPVDDGLNKKEEKLQKATTSEGQPGTLDGKGGSTASGNTEDEGALSYVLSVVGNREIESKESTFTTPDLRGDLELVCRSKAEEPPSGVRDLAQGTDKGDVGCAPVFSDLSERIFSSSDGVGEKLEEEDEGKVEENAGVSSLSAGGPKMMDTEINGDKPKPSLEGKMVVTEVGEDSSEQSDSGEEGSNSAEGSCFESDSSESEIGDAELNAEGAELGEVLERNKDKTVLGTRPDCLGAGGKSTPQQLLHPRCLIFCLSQVLSRISIMSLHTRQQVACFGPGL